MDCSAQDKREQIFDHDGDLAQQKVKPEVQPIPKLGKRAFSDESLSNEEETDNEKSKKKKQRREIQLSFVSGNLDKSVGYIAGIDEAGRGPVLGPMVYSIAFYPIEDNEKKLIKIGFNDSKQLSEMQREKLFEKIFQNEVGFIVDPLFAETLSTEMLKIDRRNLNTISHDSAIGLIGRVKELGFNLRAVYVDTVGKPDKYQKILAEEYPSIPNIIVSKKADSLFPIVGAASICAKVIRDRLLSEWQFKESLNKKTNRNFGSGYPGDQITKNWLENSMQHVFGFPSLVRYSWSTTTNLLVNAAKVHWNYEDMKAFEEINSHERMSPAKKAQLQEASNRAQSHKEALNRVRKRYNFFATNGMSRTTCL